jgi:ribose transport system ATP-binding protein
MEVVHESRATPIVALENLSKTFAGQKALRSVDLAVLPGEIHGLLGQNGSGKSTLIKILAGYYEPDPGAALAVNGRPINLPLHPGEFRRLGMSFVHQNLGLVDTLSVLDNLRVGRYRSRFFWKVNWRHERRRVRQALRRFGVEVDPDKLVSDLPESTRAIVAIARALQELEGHEVGMLILDEPTVYLSREAVDTLFNAVREVARGNISILFVSHRLEEVLAITDRVTVLRDGAVAGTAVTSEVNEDDLVEMIIGRRMTDLYPAPPEPGVKRVLGARNVSGDVVEGASFDVYEGEVLGLTGLIGSGFEELPYLLMGTAPSREGHLILGEKTVALDRMSVRGRIDAGMTLVPANRGRDGAALRLTVAENVSLPKVSSYFRNLLLNHRTERNDVLRLLHDFDVRPPQPGKIFGTLSGGNQQKAIMGKWLSCRPNVLILHEPTQGVDVGARKQIFQQIRNATERGTAVLMVSLEYEDLAHLCDRVIVFRDGRMVSELSGASLTEDRIVEQCYRGESQRAS